MERWRPLLIAALLGVALLPFLVARAEGHHKPDHDGGPPSDTSTTQATSTTETPPTTIVPPTRPPTTLPPSTTIVPPTTVGPPTTLLASTTIPSDTTTTEPPSVPPADPEDAVAAAPPADPAPPASAKSAPKRGAADKQDQPPKPRLVLPFGAMSAPATTVLGEPSQDSPELVLAVAPPPTDLPDVPPAPGDRGLLEVWYHLPPWTQGVVAASSTVLLALAAAGASVALGKDGPRRRLRSGRRWRRGAPTQEPADR